MVGSVAAATVYVNTRIAASAAAAADRTSATAGVTA